MATVATGKALDTVCFHSQQAVEKGLKAVLALQDVEYPWRHDLGELLELVKPLAPEVAPFEDRILGMTPFAVEIRYLEACSAFGNTPEETLRQVEIAKEAWLEAPRAEGCLRGEAELKEIRRSLKQTDSPH